jgi:DNA-directed RNA polymerase specialized sigma24 family protein
MSPRALRVSQFSDQALQSLLRGDARQGWRTFVDQYTPLILTLIARAGIADEDDAGDLYVLVCERLAEQQCARLKKHDPAKGALAAWLTVFVRNTVVDWVRSRAGRRRMFAAIEQLDALAQRVFELFYWDERPPAEIVEVLRTESGERVGLDAVFDALQRINAVMTDRHRRQLLALVARTRFAKSLESEVADGRLTLVASSDPEASAQTTEINALLGKALASLPAEEAAIVRLTYVHGWSRDQVQRALHLSDLSPDRLAAIVRRLSDALRALGIRRGDIPAAGLNVLREPT